MQKQVGYDRIPELGGGNYKVENVTPIKNICPDKIKSSIGNSRGISRYYDAKNQVFKRFLRLGKL